MASLLYQTIEQISREKHIQPEVIVAAIEDAMVVAARKYYRTEEELRSKFNPDTGHVDVFSVRAVVEEVTDPLREISIGDARKKQPEVEVGVEVTETKPTDVLGRIAAQTAKQVILQKVREAERDTIYNEFHTRVGELVNCIVKRTEGRDTIVDLGRTEARLPKREQSRLEAYNVGDRLRVTIRAVERAAKGPQVVVSRADPALVQRLFEMEVPEIYDGTVQIRAVAREAGERTKIAVESRDKDVDPVGACVGMKGMRVQSIIRELRGEKIDIIPYNEETIAFAQKALSPAKVTRVQVVDPEEKRLEVIVEDTQLSLAIGKKGQNVRLASKLIGWNIDIKSEEEKRREIEAQMAALTAPGTALTQLAGGSRRRHFNRKAGVHDAGTVGGNSRHRRENGGEDSPVGRRVFRSAGNGGYCRTRCSRRCSRGGWRSLSDGRNCGRGRRGGAGGRSHRGSYRRSCGGRRRSCAGCGGCSRGRDSRSGSARRSDGRGYRRSARRRDRHTGKRRRAVTSRNLYEQFVVCGIL